MKLQFIIILVFLGVQLYGQSSIDNLEKWVNELKKAKDIEKVKLLETLDSNYDSSVEDGVVFWDGSDLVLSPIAGVDLFYGQIDHDSIPEAVVQVRRYSNGYLEDFERMEGFWIGIFDFKDNMWCFMGSLHKLIYHCKWDGNPLGLLFWFTNDSLSKNPALCISIQNTYSCGTYIKYDFSKYEYSIVSDSLKIVEFKNFDMLDYDRIHRENNE